MTVKLILTFRWKSTEEGAKNDEEKVYKTVLN